MAHIFKVPVPSDLHVTPILEQRVCVKLPGLGDTHRPCHMPHVVHRTISIFNGAPGTPAARVLPVGAPAVDGASCRKSFDISFPDHEF